MADSDERCFRPKILEGLFSSALLLGVPFCLRCLNDLQAHWFDRLRFQESCLATQASVQLVVYVPLHQIDRSPARRRRRLCESSQGHERQHYCTERIS